MLRIQGSFVGQVILNGPQPLPTNLIGVSVPTFFPDRQGLAPDIDMLHIELRNRPASHTGLNERIDDGPIAIRAIPFASRPLAGLIALPIAREPADGEEQISRRSSRSCPAEAQRVFHHLSQVLEPGSPIFILGQRARRAHHLSPRERWRLSLLSQHLRRGPRLHRTRVSHLVGGSGLYRIERVPLTGGSSLITAHKPLAARPPHRHEHPCTMSRTSCARTGQSVPCIASSPRVSSIFSAPFPVGKSFARGVMQ